MSTIVIHKSHFVETFSSAIVKLFFQITNQRINKSCVRFYSFRFASFFSTGFKLVIVQSLLHGIVFLLGSSKNRLIY